MRVGNVRVAGHVGREESLRSVRSIRVVGRLARVQGMKSVRIKVRPTENMA